MKTLVLVLRRFILMLSVNSISISSAAQCPGDACSDPVILTMSFTPDSWTCVDEICNGTFENGSYQWNCEEEDQGSPQCWSQEHDYWIILDIGDFGGEPAFQWQMVITSDYMTQSGLVGSQWIIYESTDCAMTEFGGVTATDYITGDPLEFPCNIQQVDHNVGVTLETNHQYLLQIDSFGTGTGCSQVCFWIPGFLNLGVDSVEGRYPTSRDDFMQRWLRGEIRIDASGRRY